MRLTLLAKIPAAALVLSACPAPGADPPPANAPQAIAPQPGDAQPVAIKDTKNAYKVNPALYRSGQPDDDGFADLPRLGIKSVLNLREYHDDAPEAGNSPLKLFRKKLAAGKVTEDDLIDCLVIIHDAPKPILVHCWHGSDRTGIVIAAYRITVEGWEPKRALAEMTDPQYGHNKEYYQNLSALVESTDWKKFQKKYQSKISPAQD